MTGITKSFGVVSVLEGVNLKVKHGEIHALLWGKWSRKNLL
jgi:ribose transport system ATP-binding protein